MRLALLPLILIPLAGCTVFDRAGGAAVDAGVYPQLAPIDEIVAQGEQARHSPADVEAAEARAERLRARAAALRRTPPGG
ncbi:MAG: hypothetical protein WCZ72_09710 [Gemmobacter sp.]